MKHSIANIVATVIALVIGATTIWVSLRYLKHPEEGYSWAAIRDWVVLALSGFTTGTIAWFVTWGHFQEDPTSVSIAGSTFKLVEDDSCPTCGGQTRKHHPWWTIVGAVLFFPIGLILLFLKYRWCNRCKCASAPRTRRVENSAGV